jgi:membrane protease YdiL (CAAX protease family)
MPTWMDHLLVAGFALAWPALEIMRRGAFRAHVRADVPGTRLAAYAGTSTIEWLFAALVVAVWIRQERDWGALGLVLPAGGRAWAAIAVAVVAGALLVAQSAVVRARPDTHEQVRRSMGALAEVLPAHRNELTGFVAMSVAAGICEELLFRGVLPWYLEHWLGGWGAHAAAVVVFGACHASLGGPAAFRAFLAGVGFAALYLWSGSLVPGMLLHVLVDASSGWMAYSVLGRAPAPAEAPAVSLLRS